MSPSSLYRWGMPYRLGILGLALAGLAPAGLVPAGLLPARAQSALQPSQVLFAGRTIDGVSPDAQRIPSAAMAKLLVSGPLPLYPAAAPGTTVAAPLGALVQLLVLVDEKGAVSNILASDGPPDLAAAASSTVTMWSFRPSGKSPVVTTIPLLFLPPVAGQPGRVVYQPSLVHVAGGVLAGHNRHKVIPAGVRGTSVFHVVVDPHGAVAAATMISGNPQDRSAWEQALAGWRYEPYIRNGEAVWVESTVSINF